MRTYTVTVYLPSAELVYFTDVNEVNLLTPNLLTPGTIYIRHAVPSYKPGVKQPRMATAKFWLDKIAGYDIMEDEESR
jgi:hypothetical protein